MALELRRNRSQWWYGRAEANGRSYTKNLGVKVEGRIPASLREVTGHRTTDIVLKHYFQPGREDFRRTLAMRLPALLGDRSLAGSAEFDATVLRAKLTAMEDSTWRHIRDELLGRLPAEKNVTPPALPKSAFAA